MSPARVHRQIRWLLVGIASCLCATVSNGFAETQQAVVYGLVSLQETDPRQRPPRYYRGPYRSARDTVAAESALQSVIIYLADVSPPKDGWSVGPRHQMAQRHDTFIPHVLPILAGSSVGFPNQDDYYHNVFSVVAGDRFDLGRFGEGRSQMQRFDEPAIVVVRCEIHAGMKAYIVVLDNPHFTKTDADGQYRLHIPAGTHRLVGWHPTRGRVEHLLQTAPGDSVRIDLRL
jgi:plastocyanin